MPTNVALKHVATALQRVCRAVGDTQDKVELVREDEVCTPASLRARFGNLGRRNGGGYR